ncbi:MAG: TolC family protein [Acidobacteria bacterium]|nr:TolC family protein [Acidobacteriota bacterium]
MRSYYPLRAGIVLALFVYGGLAAPAQQSSLTLSQAVAIALKVNPDKQLTRDSVDAARLDAQTARTMLLPKLNFSESATRGNDPVFVFGSKLRQQIFAQSDFAPNSLNRPIPINDFATQFSGTWTAFDSWHTQFEIHKTDLLARSASASASRSDQEIVLRTIQAYESILFSLRQIDVVQHDVGTAQALLDASQTRVEAGLAVDSDRLTANAYLAERQQELLSAQGSTEVAWAELEAALGESIPADRRQLMPLSEREFADLPLQDQVAAALKARADRESLQLQGDAARSAVQAAKSAFGPQINTYGTWEMDKGSFAGSGGNNWVAGAELRIDILPAAKRQNLAAAKIALDRTDAAKAAADRTIQLQVTRAYYEHHTAGQMLLVAKASMNQADEGLRILQERYAAGLATMTDLLRTEDAARQSRASYWQAVFSSTLTYAALKFADGTLNQDSAGDLQ